MKAHLLALLVDDPNGGVKKRKPPELRQPRLMETATAQPVRPLQLLATAATPQPMRPWLLLAVAAAGQPSRQVLPQLLMPEAAAADAGGRSC